MMIPLAYDIALDPSGDLLESEVSQAINACLRTDLPYTCIADVRAAP